MESQSNAIKNQTTMISILTNLLGYLSNYKIGIIMPKYTTNKLEIYLKKDSKKIKKENNKLKNVEILNVLSNFIGYKNFQEITNRCNDKKLIELTNLTEQELDEIRKNYEQKVSNFYNLPYFYTSLTDLIIIKDIVIEKNLSFSKNIKIDFSKYKTVLKLSNRIFNRFIKKGLKLSFCDDKDKSYLNSSISLFEIIIEIMEHKNIIDYQNEFINYNSYDVIKSEYEKIEGNCSLKEKIGKYIDIDNELNRSEINKYENHGYLLMFISNFAFNPYIDTTSLMKKKYNKILDVENVIKSYSTIELKYHAKRFNDELLFSLFSTPAEGLYSEIEDRYCGFRTKESVEVMNGRLKDIKSGKNVFLEVINIDDDRFDIKYKEEYLKELAQWISKYDDFDFNKFNISNHLFVEFEFKNRTFKLLPFAKAIMINYENRTNWVTKECYVERVPLNEKEFDEIIEKYNL